MEKQIKGVREQIMGYDNKRPGKMDPMDLEQINNKDWIVERYLLDANANEKKAANNLVKTLKFYKLEGLPLLTDQFFPAEFYATGWLIRWGVSRKGNRVTGLAMRCHYPLNEISDDMADLGRKFILYFLYKNRMELDPKALTTYIANDEVTMANIDTASQTVVVDFVNNYMPRNPLTVLIADLPSVVSTIYKAVLKLFKLPLREKMVFTSMKDVYKWIDWSEIPEYVGGNMKGYKRIPDGVQSGKCLKHLSYIKSEDWDRFTDLHIVCIREGMKDEGIPSLEKYLRYCRQ